MASRESGEPTNTELQEDKTDGDQSDITANNPVDFDSIKDDTNLNQSQDTGKPCQEKQFDEKQCERVNSIPDEMKNRLTIGDVEKSKLPVVEGLSSNEAESIGNTNTDNTNTLVTDTNSQSVNVDTNNTTTKVSTCDSSNEGMNSNKEEAIGDDRDQELEFFSDQSESGDEYESAEEGEESHTDSANLKELEDKLTEEEKEERQCLAREYKEEGNQLFRDGSYKSAIRLYSRGLRTCPLKYGKDRAVLYANRAACKVKLEEFDDAIRDCTKALDLNADYMKPLMRRAELYEQTDKLEEALADYQRILDLDPSQHKARAACMKLPDIIKERNEKLKEEMMGKLKELGNMVLRPFGLSTNNFKMNQDPNTGGYSVNFVQSPDN